MSERNRGPDWSVLIQKSFAMKFFGDAVECSLGGCWSSLSQSRLTVRAFDGSMHPTHSRRNDGSQCSADSRVADGSTAEVGGRGRHGRFLFLRG